MDEWVLLMLSLRRKIFNERHLHISNAMCEQISWILSNDMCSTHRSIRYRLSYFLFLLLRCSIVVKGHASPNRMAIYTSETSVLDANSRRGNIHVWFYVQSVIARGVCAVIVIKSHWLKLAHIWKIITRTLEFGYWFRMISVKVV